MRKIFADTTVQSVLASITSILCGLLFGLIIMYIFNPSGALPGFAILLQGGFADGMRGIGNVLYYATPYMLLGLAVAFSFQTGVFNIGVSGQFTVGTFTAIMIATKCTFIPGPLQWVVAVLGAGIMGMIWGAIPGLMKAYFRTNEVVSCIMANYIAMYLVNQLTKEWSYDKSLVGTKYVQESALMPKVGLDKIFPNSTVNLGFFIAIAMCILIYIILYKTTFGYELRACGFNREASHYCGINEKRNVIAVMLIAGFIAGVAGGILHLSSISKYYKIQETFIKETNYAIPIALLASSHPIGVIFSALFIAYITIGGSLMQGQGFPVETIDMITAVIIYFAAFSLIIKQAIARLAIRKSGTIDNANAEPNSIQTPADLLPDQTEENPEATKSDERS